MSISSPEPSRVEIMRHSAAHVLAAAVLKMFPEAKFGIGPVIENGFYYDFELPRTLIPEDLPLLEETMREIIRENYRFERAEMSIATAREKFRQLDQPFKVEIIDDLETLGESGVSVYESGFFVDLCKGPHLDSTGEIARDGFMLSRISGAYWKSDESKQQLQRIYGVAFETKKDLKAYLFQQEEAKKRDHRVLGKQLGLFTLSDLVGAGLPLFQPKGMILRQELENYLWDLHKDKGYGRVWTPHIAKEKLYVTSGHAAKFGDELFRVQGKDDAFFLKPMNCPHHMQIFADNQFSYRDMPIRYFEPATVYRDEKSGQLGGLTRVRSITQDDGHLFCRVSQIKREVATIVSVIREFYTTIGMMEDYWVSLSVRGEDRSKYLGTEEAWATAESSLEEAAKENDLNYRRIAGEAAFYGPKLDFMFKDVIGRQWQLATIQCDFNLPERFDLSFIDEKGAKERPVVIHRAISGALERFIAILIEHCAGAFPTWLAPVQVAVLPISEKFADYAQAVLERLRHDGVRASVRDEDESLGKRIRSAEKEKIPYILVVGEKESEASTVTVRRRSVAEQETMSLDSFAQSVLTEIRKRA